MGGDGIERGESWYFLASHKMLQIGQYIAFVVMYSDSHAMMAPF